MNVHSVSELCQRIDEQVQEITDEWLAIAVEEPWIGLPVDERLDGIRALVAAILRSALCSPTDVAAHREKIEAAARHGIERRKQGFDTALLFSGHYFVREAIRRCILRLDLPHRVATDALLRIDIATTMATLASLRGYHRAEHEQHTAWSEMLDQMTRESLQMQANH